MQSQKDNSVFFISMAVTAATVLWGIISPASFDAAAKGLFGFLIEYFGWGYMLAMNIFVLFPILLCMSRFGKLRLGEPGSKPEFSNISWFAMLFSAGMGVGLVFYGVGEPVFHFMTPPFGAA
ncbi:MAG TPA: BCCT family transporter, partial [Aminivibrio sp.]|nr:BCCT family transporter [Aminivibrio sp.]